MKETDEVQHDLISDLAKHKETDIKYLKMAFENARDKGTDPSTQNGAVIVSADG